MGRVPGQPQNPARARGVCFSGATTSSALTLPFNTHSTPRPMAATIVGSSPNTCRRVRVAATRALAAVSQRVVRSCDVEGQLGIRGCLMFRGRYNRPNLFYAVALKPEKTRRTCVGLCPLFENVTPQVQV